jgi:hypothetical protein
MTPLVRVYVKTSFSSWCWGSPWSPSHGHGQPAPSGASAWTLFSRTAGRGQSSVEREPAPWDCRSGLSGTRRLFLPLFALVLSGSRERVYRTRNVDLGAEKGAWPIARSRCWRSRRSCGGDEAGRRSGRDRRHFDGGGNLEAGHSRPAKDRAELVRSLGPQGAEMWRRPT